MARVVEYLGLPAVGKSWHLQDEGYRSTEGAWPHEVPTGLSWRKAGHTLRGLVSHGQLFLLLLIAWWRASRPNGGILSSRPSVRPVFVVFERLGRCERLRREASSDYVHVDEGPLQFVWRVFFPATPNAANVSLLGRCLGAYRHVETSVVYFSCPPEERHRRIIRDRGKSAAFDRAVIEGDDQGYWRGRQWMAELLRMARRRGIGIGYVSPIGTDAPGRGTRAAGSNP